MPRRLRAWILGVFVNSGLGCGENGVRETAFFLPCLRDLLSMLVTYRIGEPVRLQISDENPYLLAGPIIGLLVHLVSSLQQSQTQKQNNHNNKSDENPVWSGGAGSCWATLRLLSVASVSSLSD